MYNLKFSAVCELWLKYCVYGRKDPITKQTYKGYQVIAKILNYILGDCAVTEITQDHVVRIRQYVYARERSAGYLHRLLSVLRSILRYCEDELQLNVLRPEKVKLPSQQTKDVEYLTIEQLRIFLAEIKTSTIQGVRLMAMFVTFLDTGMRMSEVCSLNRTGEHTIDFISKTAKIVGKGNKIRIVYFRDWSLSWIKAYLRLRRDNHPALFVSHDPTRPTDRLSPYTVRKSLLRIKNKIGIRGNAQKLRRTAATHLFGNGADLRTVQQFLGHSHVQVTERYVGPNLERLRRDLATYQRYGIEAQYVPRLARRMRQSWAKGHRNCRVCRRTAVRHAARGFCYNCYMNDRNKKIRQIVATRDNINT